MRAYVRFQETGKSYSGETVYVGKNLTRKFIIDFFGLNQPDILWYEIKLERIASAAS